MNDYEKLKKIYDEIDELIALRIDASSPMLKAWKMKAERFLIKKYGVSSYELQKFRECKFRSFDSYFSPDPFLPEKIEYCRKKLKEMKAIFANLLEELKEEYQVTELPKQQEEKDYRRVFIVHSHNGELKRAVVQMLEKQGIIAVVLYKREPLSAAIIEKIEKYSGVQAAICLFTADDLGSDASKEIGRIMRNVVFETGYFIGKLGRKNTVILSDQDIEMPSDLAGVVYVGEDWRYQILKELKAIGYEIDFQKM